MYLLILCSFEKSTYSNVITEQNRPHNHSTNKYQIKPIKSENYGSSEARQCNRSI